jgi:hypothetical protein
LKFFKSASSTAASGWCSNHAYDVYTNRMASFYQVCTIRSRKIS